jgi:hypothetical protein
VLAEDVIESGITVEVLLKFIAQQHIGDMVAATCCIISTASSSVLNAKGLHVMLTGQKGIGKSHLADVHVSCIPDKWKVEGTLSDKALYYDDPTDVINPESVFIYDDQTPSSALEEVYKQQTSDFKKPAIHRTVIKQQRVKLKAPERCTWIRIKVDATGDEQTQSRNLFPYVDESPEQQRRIQEFAALVESLPYEEQSRATDTRLPKMIWEVLRQQEIFVELPFAKELIRPNVADSREARHVDEMIKCFALLRFLARPHRKAEDGTIVIRATRWDVEDTSKLYTALTTTHGSQKTKTPFQQKKLLETIKSLNPPDGEFTIPLLQKATGLSYNTIYNHLMGRDDGKRRSSGLFTTCSALIVISGGKGMTVYEREIDSETGYQKLVGATTKRENVVFTVDRNELDKWMNPCGYLGLPQDWSDRTPNGYECNPINNPESVKNEVMRRVEQYLPILPQLTTTNVSSNYSDLPNSNNNNRDNTTTYHNSNNVSEMVKSDQNDQISDILSHSGKSGKFSESGNIPVPDSPTGSGMNLHMGGKTGGKCGKVVSSHLPGSVDVNDVVDISPRLKMKCTQCGGRAAYRVLSGNLWLCESCYTGHLREKNISEGI